MKNSIADISFDGVVILGPMAGFTSLAYREYNKSFGIAYSVSEMISDAGLVYGNIKTFDYLKTSVKDRPVALQLFGASKEVTLKAIDIIENQRFEYDFLDLNFGCPVNKVTKTGAGSAWHKRIDELYDYVNSIVVKSKKPVTAKIRLGWNDANINFRVMIKTLEEAGVSAICVHSRTTKQLYSGTARHELLKNLQDEIKVPLIISGDIFSLDDAIKAKEITKAKYIMVARGAIGNPFLIKQINHYFKTGEKLPSMSNNEICLSAVELCKMLIDEKGEFAAVRVFRSIAPFYIKHMSGEKKNMRQQINGMCTLKDVKEIFAQPL